MRITQWGEYGVLLSSYIAKRDHDGASTVGAAEIARAQDIDIQYAQQILQRLRKGGIIRSERGPSGGYRLCRPASEITLLDILVATEGDSFEVICDSKPINSTRCASQSSCGLRGIWYDLKDHMNVFLRKYTLEELSQMPNIAFSQSAADDPPINIRGRAG